MRNSALSVFIIVCALIQQSLAQGSFPIVQNSQPEAVIVLSDNPQDDEKLAASELQQYIFKMSGATLEISNKAESGKKQIVIGQSFLKDSGISVDGLGTDKSSFVISVGEDTVYLAGNSAEGTLFAAYEFLEKLGVRWFWPGELGMVVPKMNDIAVEIGTDIQIPSFPNRHLQDVPRNLSWYRQQKLGGIIFPGKHGIDLYPPLDPKKDAALTALVDGKRFVAKTPKLCLSNPDVLTRAVAFVDRYFEAHPDLQYIGMGPTDGQSYCECENCKALDGDFWDPIYNVPSVTDRYIWFFNQILDAIKDKWPDKKIAFYIYQNHIFPPVRYVPNKNITGAFAPIGLCRFHGASNPICPDRSLYKNFMVDWGKLLPELWERGYYFNLASAPFPFSKIHTLKDEMTLAYDNNIKGWRVESFPSWVSNGLTLYVAAQLMWDVNADVDAIVHDFYDKFFGPASEPMGKWLDLMYAAYRDTDCHVGASLGMPAFFPPEKMKQAKTYFEQAEKSVQDNPPYQERVRVSKLNFEMLDDYLNMWDARNSHDFKNAYKYYNACVDKIGQLGFYYLEPDDSIPGNIKNDWSGGQAIHTRYAPLLCKPAIGYLARFNYETLKSGYDKTCVEGQLVAKVSDEWDFLIDPKGVGESMNWFSDTITGGNWQKISTSKTWSEQGYHYYNGLAWYRNTVCVPSEYKGRKLYLWFGAVDELAKVWINGHALGESFAQSPELPGYPMAFKPFEFDITPYVKFDQPNTIAVKITNVQLNEIGSGGIIAPVMIYTPAEGKDND